MYIAATTFGSSVSEVVFAHNASVTLLGLTIQPVHLPQGELKS